MKHSPDRIVGSISLSSQGDTNRGFWLGLPWQGQGLMTEASEVVTDY
jgi:[ribosomal protein S5]-alanine N-acetyltransferase